MSYEGEFLFSPADGIFNSIEFKNEECKDAAGDMVLLGFFATGLAAVDASMLFKASVIFLNTPSDSSMVIEVVMGEIGVTGSVEFHVPVSGDRPKYPYPASTVHG